MGNKTKSITIRYRRSIALIVGAIACLLAVRAAPLRADSIWENRDERHAYLFRDDVAREVGDSLTVIISEESGFTKEGERTMSKETGHTADASMKTGIAGTFQNSFNPLDLDESSERSFESENEHSSSRSFGDSITVTAVDRLPNGNLVVAGRSERRIAGEDVITVLTGIVRPTDIAGNNTVSSRRVAHARIFYRTYGDSTWFMEQGWLNKTMNYLWPL